MAYNGGEQLEEEVQKLDPLQCPIPLTQSAERPT